MLNPSTHSQDYPSSYYFFSARYLTDYPALEQSLRADVCVIGGGYTGINTALELAERGFSVVVLEAYRIGWGASGRNGGQLIRGIGHGLGQFKNQIGTQGIEAIERMGFEAVDIVKSRIAEHQIDCDLTLGYCDLANRSRHMREFEAEKIRLERLGYPFALRLVDKADMESVIGADCYAGGLVDMGSGHLHPLNLITAEARVAAAAGVQIFERSAVVSIEYGETCVVRTGRGQVTADKLVIGANAYGAGLHPALESRVLPCGSYIVATEPLSDELCQRLLPERMAVCDQRVALDYFRLSADNRLLFGGRCNYLGRDPKNIAATMRPDMLKVFPYLKDAAIEFEWGGMIGIGANRLPQIGRLRRNVYYAQAYAGHGVNASHMAARLLAEAISHESSRMDVFGKVKHMRFPGGHRFRSPLLALGMLYYRFLDLF